MIGNKGEEMGTESEVKLRAHMIKKALTVEYKLGSLCRVQIIMLNVKSPLVVALWKLVVLSSLSWGFQNLCGGGGGGVLSSATKMSHSTLLVGISITKRRGEAEV